MFFDSKANHLLKGTGASNNSCIDYIVSSLGGDKWLLNKQCICHRVIHSRDSFKNTESSSNEASEVSFKLLFLILILKIGLFNILYFKYTYILHFLIINMN